MSLWSAIGEALFHDDRKRAEFDREQRARGSWADKPVSAWSEADKREHEAWRALNVQR